MGGARGLHGRSWWRTRFIAATAARCGAPSPRLLHRSSEAGRPRARSGGGSPRRAAVGRTRGCWRSARCRPWALSARLPARRAGRLTERGSAPTGRCARSTSITCRRWVASGPRPTWFAPSWKPSRSRVCSAWPGGRAPGLRLSRAQRAGGGSGFASSRRGLVADRFILLGGPVGDHRQTLHVVEAADEREVRRRVAEDPWAHARLLEVGSIRPWALWLEGQRRAASPRRPGPGAPGPASRSPSGRAGRP